MSFAAWPTFACCIRSRDARTWSSWDMGRWFIMASRRSPAFTIASDGQGFLLWETSRNTAFEGEGDVTFSDDGGTLWAGHGSRTARTAHAHIADAWHVPVRSLKLVDPRFFHLDTCFTPLHGGFVLYYPGAFDTASLAAIEKAYPAEKRIAVAEADATHMACCALNIGRAVFTGELSRELAMRLFDAGFDVVQLELSEFIRGGGGAKSLALRLSDLPVTHGVLARAQPPIG
jgi:N-dimethylarginine dimethylaminohydrolase